MNYFSKNIFIPIVIIVLGFISVFVLSDQMEKIRPETAENYSDANLFLEGKRLKGYMFGLEGLAADWYWMRSLQYIGDKLQQSNDKVIDIADLRPLNPRLLKPYLENATDLDPQFTTVYSYGAVVLPAINPDDAIQFIEKGIKNNPNNWRLYQHLGFIYWRLGKFEKAAETYEKGAAIKDAPAFFKSMQAQMENKSGSRETAREIYQQMFKEAEDSQTKEVAALKLAELQSQDERDAVNKVLGEFKNKNGRCVTSLQEIFPFLSNVKLPQNKDFRIDKNKNLVDPSDVPYLLDQEKCTLNLNPKKTKIPIYQHL